MGRLTDRDDPIINAYSRDLKSHGLINHRREVELSTIIRGFLEEVEEFVESLPVKERGKYFPKNGNMNEGVDYDAIIRDYATNWDSKSIDLYFNSRNELVEANLRLVMSIARGRRGASLQDLIASGNEGLMRASQLYDGSTKFSTYATIHIKQKMRLIENSARNGVLYFPLNVQRGMSLAHKAKRYCENEDLPLNLENLGEFARISGGNFSDSQLKNALFAYKQKLNADRSIVAEIHTKDGDVYVQASEKDESRRASDINELKEAVNLAMEGLDERERRILELRFGLTGNEPLSRKEVGKIIGHSKEWIGQIEKESLKKLREFF